MVARPSKRVVKSGVMAIALTLAAAAPCALAEAEFRCAALLPSTTRSPPYAKARGEARCEGYFAQNVSQPFIEVVSLTRYRPDAAQAGTGALQIKASTTVATRLLIQPLGPSTFYRVDAGLAAGQALSWSAAPMLRATGLRVADLGFVARQAEVASAAPADVPVLVPVSVQPAVDEPATAYALLRVSVAVTSMAARSYRLEGGTSVAMDGTWRTMPGTPLDAWDAIALPIALPADQLPLNVDVRAIGTDAKPLPLLRFVVLVR